MPGIASEPTLGSSVNLADLAAGGQGSGIFQVAVQGVLALLTAEGVSLGFGVRLPLQERPDVDPMPKVIEVVVPGMTR